MNKPTYTLRWFCIGLTSMLLTFFPISQVQAQIFVLDETFEGSTELQLFNEDESHIELANGTLIFSGGSGSGWTGDGTNTTYQNAFTDNALHRASASKLIHAENYNQLELQIKFKQTAGGFVQNSWFRVMANGVALPDACGKISYNPATLNGDSTGYISYNLDSYGGTSFVLSLQSSCRVNPSDKVIIDEVRILASSINLKRELSVSEYFNPGFLPSGYVTCREMNSLGWQIGSYAPISGIGNYAYSINQPGDGVLSNNKLITPILDLTSQTNVSLNLNFATSTGGKLLASTDGGLTWTMTLLNFPSTQGVWQNTSISLSSLNGQNNVRLAFAHLEITDQFSIFAIDNLQFTATNNSTSNLQLKSFISPIQQSLYSTPEIVSVRVKNLGNTLSGYSVSYQLNGGLIQTVNVSNPLASGDSSVVSFPTPVLLGTLGYQTFKAWTHCAYDTNHSNDTLSQLILVTQPVISTFPYIESFESTHYWSVGGNNPDWGLVQPSGTIINSASDGVKAWVTNPTGFVNSFKKEWLVSPIFNFSTLQNPELQLDFICSTANFEDGACVQYSLDGGSTWSTLGIFGDPNNWYTASFVTGLSQLTSSQGWSGTLYQTWTTATHSLSLLAGQSSVRFRIYFGSDLQFDNYEGFAFDNFIIKELQSYDPGISSIEYPNGTCILGSQEPIVAAVTNYGFNPISGCLISYSLDGLNFINETISQSIAPGETIQYTFNQMANFTSSGGYELHLALSHPQDGYLYNNEKQISLTYTQSTSLPYTENFENGTLPQGWETKNALGAAGWLIGNDYTSTYFNIPSHTVYAASNDDACYCNSSNDLLISPYFDLSYYTSFTLLFDAFYTGEFYSSAVVLISTDCGYTWTDVYYLPSNTLNWQPFSINLNAYAGEQSVRIAFKHDDNGGWASGFAIDNVSFIGNTNVTSQEIELKNGWSIISTYINPTTANIATVFTPVVSNLIIIKDENGQVYWPGFGVNSINNMMIGEGYQVFMSSLSTLTIHGTMIAPENTPLLIGQTWSLVGYLRTTPMAIETAFAAINPVLVIAKDEIGMVYWPGFGVNTIGQLNPGKGYQIKLTTASTLTYPAN
ncbi:MAG: choice-of-anchor J domain-containing protein [Bacteroidales bacterium]|nr:choice-of-anchor J domain-containing protein [Bacteroidales bacterium]